MPRTKDVKKRKKIKSDIDSGKSVREIAEDRKTSYSTISSARDESSAKKKFHKKLKG